MYLRHLLAFQLLLSSVFPLFSQVEVQYPQDHIVIQRNNENEGTVYITGTLSQDADGVEVRFMKRPGEPGESTESWAVLDNSVQNRTFFGIRHVKGGRYDLEVKAVKNNEQVGSVTVVEKVGIGEVFLIVGHSNAQGIATGTPAQSDMVISVNPNTDLARHELYTKTANPDLLPDSFSPLAEGCGMAPFNNDPWFWGKFGDLAVQNLGVPVLIYSAAFGGSNIWHTYKSALGESFEHGFIKSDIRMPYINIENTLIKLVPKTGLRAILSAHGINDAGSTQSEFYNNHKNLIAFTATPPKFNNLAWMIANACYNNGVVSHIYDAQEQLMQLDNVFRGPNLNSIGHEGRGNSSLPIGPGRDALHFNELGQEMAASLWSEAVSGEEFLRNSSPIPPDIPEERSGTLPVTVVSINAQPAENGAIRLSWSTSREIDHSHFEIQYSYNAQQFHAAGTRQGAGNSFGITHYEYTVPGPFLAKHIYFRLNQIDLDGTSEFSDIISVKVQSPAPGIFYPNPSDGVFHFQAPDHFSPRNISIYDSQGILLQEVRESSRIDLSTLRPGVYFAVIEDQYGLKITRKITRL